MNIGDPTAPRARPPLRADKALLHEEGACLPLRSRHGHCRRCEQACPAAAISVTVAGVELADGCTGCGVCTAACPTSALGLAEMARMQPDAAQRAAGRVRVECRMVPAERRGDGVETPCLGALTPGNLLAWAAEGVAVQIVDRGWCGDCPARGARTGEGHPAAGAVELATAWLAAVQQGPQPTIVREALPVALRPAALPAAAADPQVSRRSFFRKALDKPAGRDRPTPMGGDGRAAYPAEDRLPSAERQRQHDALQTLARRGGVEVPAEFFPSLHVDATCCDRRMCVALCPTAALTVADEGGTAHLQFDPVRCIGCGTCERACPEGALSLTAHGGTPAVQTLISHQRYQCRSCGDVFSVVGETPSGAVTTCPTCAKSDRFMEDARRQLFGASPTTPRSI